MKFSASRISVQFFHFSSKFNETRLRNQFLLLSMKINDKITILQYAKREFSDVLEDVP